MLRKLEKKDAPLMLEWMHDPSVVEHLNRDFGALTLEDCEAFIEKAAEGADADWKTMTGNLHLAIEDEQGEYMGTVSLKEIDRETSSAEFGITVRTCTMGRGISIAAMKEIVKIGHEVMGLDLIFWCVSKYNTRAVRFYEKNGFEKITLDELKQKNITVDYTEEQMADFVWYKA